MLLRVSRPLVAAFELVCSVTQGKRLNTKMRKEIRAKFDESRKDASAAFTLPFDTRDVWGKARTASLLVMGKRTMKEWVVIHYKDWACFHSGIERVGRL
jgi:hypothetical protein